MNILVTGANGQVGSDIVEQLNMHGYNVKACNRNDLDITNHDAVMNTVKNFKTDIVIHCAAYTNVDKAETEKTECFNVNVVGTKNIVRACKLINAKMIYFSTDYVFDGLGERPWKESDKKNPINFYGYTKAMGEDIVEKNLKKYFIIRISWVFGKNGGNFVKTMLNIGKKNNEIKVVADQIGSPTYTVDLAKLVCKMISTNKYGIYHITNGGECSWYSFALKIMKEAKISCSVQPILSSEYDSKACRPKNSKLEQNNLIKNGFYLLPSWDNALKRFLKEITIK